MSGHGSRGRLAIAMVVLIIALILKECHSEDPCLADMDPPIVTCSNVTTPPFEVNSFLGLNFGIEYTNMDVNFDPSGVSYNVTIGKEGDLFPPGHTPVTLFVADTCMNVATCLFYVENTLTELPVNCPDLNRSVSTDVDQATYTFNPDFGADDVTQPPNYRYHGGSVSVNLTLGGSPVGSSVSIGTHEVVALIYDDVLDKTCTGIYIIADRCDEGPDMDPPDVTCSNISLPITEPNTFFGLTRGYNFTYTDVNPSLSNVTFNVTIGISGDLYPPGYTPVTMFAVDVCNNSASCLFHVENTLTKLPVNCPHLSRNVSTDVDQATYTFNLDFEAHNVTKSVESYRYHGGSVSVTLTLGGSPLGSSVSIGTHEVVALIYDDVLNKTCTGTYVVEDKDPPIVTCLNVTLPPESPNTFSGLTNGSTYNYTDASTDPNGVTYSVTLDDDLFPPGYTPVTMFAVDVFNNSESCLFYVQNTLTELPVNCSDFNRNVSTDVDQATYTFNLDFGEENVTKSVDSYRYHGGSVSVNLTLGGSPLGSSVSIGTHEVVALIYDDVLNKTCTGTYNIQDVESPFIKCSNITVPFGNVVHNYDATVLDNVDEPSLLRVDFAPKPPGQRLEPGVNEISATVTDSAGNINSTICYIDIQMRELPVEISQAIAVPVRNTYFLYFTGRLNEGLTSYNFSFYGNITYDPIVVNGMEEFQPAGLSPGVNNIRIEATDGVLSKTIEFVLNVTSNLTVYYALPGNVILAKTNGIIATFMQDLLDDTTTTFKNLALELQAQLDEIYQNTSGFIGSRVESFRNGSIIANFILIFTRTSSITEVEANEIFKSALTSDAEITSGSGLFLTSIDAFNISFPCENLNCENNGTCIDGSGEGCRCTEGWTGDRCQTSTNSTSPSIAVIVGTTAGALFLFILLVVLCMHALRNSMMMKYQSSRGHSRPTSRFWTRDYNSSDHRVPSRGNPIAHHEDRSRDRSHRNTNMDRDMALFTQYKSREQRRASQNFKTGPSYTRRAPSHEPLQTGHHQRNGIPLRDSYYYSGKIHL